jgi:hypothetical protein
MSNRLSPRAVKEAVPSSQPMAQTDNASTDHELVRQRVERVIIHADEIAVALRGQEIGSDKAEGGAGANFPIELTIPFAPNGR